MSRLLEWVKGTVDTLDGDDIIVGIGIGIIIFCVLLLAAVFLAFFGPVGIVPFLVFLLCIGMGVLIAGSL